MAAQQRAEVFDKVASTFGTVLVIVDQPASIGALPLTVPLAADCTRPPTCPACPCGGSPVPGEVKTDDKNAAVIADAARPMPHTPRSLALWKAGRGKLVEVIRPEAPPIAARLIDEVFDALDEQTVVVRASAPAFAARVRRLARSRLPLHDGCRARGKTHTQALLRLARQLLNVLFAMLS